MTKKSDMEKMICEMRVDREIQSLEFQKLNSKIAKIEMKLRTNKNDIKMIRNSRSGSYCYFSDV